MKTIRLVYPQWQGGDITRWIPELTPDDAARGYYLGALLLDFLAPRNGQATFTVPVTTAPAAREAVDGVLDRDAILCQMQAALELLERERPDRVVTLGGECSVSVAPFTYLARRYADDMAVVWIDAHPDITLPGDAYAGFHAMALTACMGRGDARIVSALPAHIDPSRVLLVGVRDWERPEIEARRRQYGIRHLTPGQRSRPGVAAFVRCFAGRRAFRYGRARPCRDRRRGGRGSRRHEDRGGRARDRRHRCDEGAGGPDRRRADAPHGRPHSQHAARTSVAAVIRDRCGHDEAAAGEFPPAAAFRTASGGHFASAKYL